MTVRPLCLAALLALPAAAPAAALEAMRCNMQTKPGLFQPVLRIMDGGKMEDIRMGTQGLTRAMFYRDRDVLAYVAQRMDKEPALMPKRVSKVCGAVEDDGNQNQSANAAVAASIEGPARDPQPETQPETEIESSFDEELGSTFEGDEAAF